MMSRFQNRPSSCGHRRRVMIILIHFYAASSTEWEIYLSWWEIRIEEACADSDETRREYATAWLISAIEFFFSRKFQR
ncbi:uncharacterized protein LY89DRAFT_690595 [Mollisia scopiformis]|uniref:Uncharacterized protein n=1 Tax=Mollisia scopiformis TaxID=149040 RepID=A0A132B9K6_MOLSC|nr:uncharacterized protein LY89DRAFT_690595 [Mollisia scopiformis]KUJ09051.1 hypothetical protein LY89DRAFT_690595 [Mollisia scopiformis]